MKVLYWTHAFWPSIGGLEMLSLHLLPALRERGHELEVITCSGADGGPLSEFCQGFRVHRIPFLQLLARRDVKGMLEARRLLTQIKRSFRPEVVHVNYCDPSSIFHLQTGGALPSATLVSVYSFLGSISGEDSLQRRILSEADWLAAPSADIRDAVLSQVPEAVDGISVIYPGNPLGERAPSPFPPPAEPVLLCMGRMVPDKGFDLALEAFALVAADFPGARLVLSGDGPARPALEAQAAELGLADRVSFPGWISHSPDTEEVLRAIGRSTIVIVPSRHEPFGLVAFQASQVGRPVLASRTGGLMEIVDHGRSGLLFERDDGKGLAEGISLLLSSPPLCESMGEAGRRRISEMFPWSDLVDGYDELYRRLPEAGISRQAGERR